MSRLALPVVLLALTACGTAVSAPTAQAPQSPQATAPAAVTVAAPGSAALQLSSNSGAPGAVVLAQGVGFTPSSSGSVSVPGRTWPVSTASDGSFQVAVTIPFQVTGNVVTVVAQVGAVPTTADFHIHSLRFGVATPGGPTAAGELGAVTAQLGEAPGTVLSFTNFSSPLDVAGLQAVEGRGAIPVVTWLPLYDPPSAPGQPTLQAIASGAFDGYVSQFARDAKAFGAPFWLRFAHEMNCPWYSWSEAHPGNSPGQYIAAWRHIHDLFTQIGATNVTWVWAPNVPAFGCLDLGSTFPGRDYVDVLGLDGYNWGTSQTWSRWQEPAEVFDAGLAQLRALGLGIPILISETASAEVGGNKAAWTIALFQYLTRQPDVTGLIWFDIRKETAWNFDSSPDALAAFRTALAARP